ncbi:MAG: small multi-drug export protein [Oscillospiraceae bacterium]|nr:small multi-drug export protein [Oscillospiraceae bacterium]
MVPVFELRGGLPMGVSFGLPFPVAITAAIIGNLIPVPFIIIFISRIFAFLRRKIPKLEKFISALEDRAKRKGDIVEKYSAIGLCLLVAIPLPGTGAWTGSLVAAILNIRLKRAVPAIVVGVLIAAAIVTAVTYGVVRLV